MLRRLLSITYDLLLLFAVLFILTVVLNVVFGPERIQSSRLLYPFGLFFISYLYFAWHWIHGGQTLGMKAWKLVIKKNDGLPLDWKVATIRFFLALIMNCIFLSGLLWALFDSNRDSLYDRLSNTTLVRSA